MDADLMYVLLPLKEQLQRDVHKDMIRTQSEEYIKAIDALSKKAKEMFSDNQ